MHTLRNALPDLAIFILLIACAVIADSVLHLAGQAGLGRYLGYVGTLLLLCSFLYSARKRNWIKSGKLSLYLRGHEICAWSGAVLILVHGGVHFNALLPWLAMVSMMIALASGLTGRYILKRSLKDFRTLRENLLDNGLTKKDAGDRLFWDALMIGAMKKWRYVHFRITAAFIFLFLIHVTSIFVFWDWNL